MKNKSKLKKIKAQKKTGTTVPAQWLYLCPQEITVRDIWRLFQPTDNTSAIADNASISDSTSDASASRHTSENDRAIPESTDSASGHTADDHLSLEIWEAAGVLEITLSDGKTIDFETAPLDLHDEYSNQFLAKHQTKSLFYVTLKPDSFSLTRPVMESIVKKLQGIFCGDTDDFTPVI